MTQSKTPHPRLTPRQGNALCREFLPIGDRVFDYMEQLNKEGFAAFRPRREYIESFATNDEELAIHRRCVVEAAKERLGRPEPMCMHGEFDEETYSSPYLERLRAERDEANGVPENQLSSRYPGESAWRREVDPCQRRLVQTECNHREIYEARFATMLDDEIRALDEECAIHATGLGRVPHTFDNKGRYVFFTAVMERDAAALGFRYDKAKSRTNYPVFSKAITEDWHLCWVIPDAHMFFSSPFEGRFSPDLELRGHNLCGASAEFGERLQIRARGQVLGNGYWRYCNLDQLETAIRAHLHFYGLIAPIIERGITKVLGAESNHLPSVRN